MPSMRRNAKHESLFWAKVDKSGECWLWTAGRFTSGYGQFNQRAGGPKLSLAAHRVAWQLASGEIPEGLCVLHKCDNRLCVNPAHLFLGTKRDNTADMIKKGRKNTAVGNQKPNSRLTPCGVALARQMRRCGVSGREIAKRFGVGPTTIRRILSGLSWKHVD